MAEKYAVVTGNWSDTATWDGGVKPVAGDTVHANNFTVTMDEDATVALITTKSGTTAVAGGKFVVGLNNLTITADIEAGTTTCVENNFGTFNIIGDVVGANSGASRVGIYTFAGSITNHTGNSTGGTGSTSFGHDVRGTCNMTGDIYGGTGNFAHGMKVSGQCYHTGRAIGTTRDGVDASGYYEVSEVTSTGSAVGVFANSGQVVVSVIRQIGMLFPARGNINFNNDPSQVQIIAPQQDGSSVTLTDATAAANYPAENEVESGVVFGNTNQFTGTLQVVDAAQLASDLLDEIQTSSHVVAQRLRAAATDDSVGSIVTSTLGAP